MPGCPAGRPARRAAGRWGLPYQALLLGKTIYVLDPLDPVRCCRASIHLIHFISDNLVPFPFQPRGGPRRNAALTFFSLFNSTMNFRLALIESLVQIKKTNAFVSYQYEVDYFNQADTACQRSHQLQKQLTLWFTGKNYFSSWVYNFIGKP